MPKKTTKAAQQLINLHNSTRESVEKSLKEKGYMLAVGDIAELVGIQKSVENLIDFQGCNHGTIVVDASGNPSDEDEPDWRIKFITSE